MADSVPGPLSRVKEIATSSVVQYVLLALGCVGIFAVIIMMGLASQSKDKSDEIKKQLGAIFAITFILCALFALAAYIYFSSYPSYLTNFVLVMTFVNLALSIFAVSVSTINVST
jgi:hypothetical protein